MCSSVSQLVYVPSVSEKGTVQETGCFFPRKIIHFKNKQYNLQYSHKEFLKSMKGKPHLPNNYLNQI